jgi:hypothetical protein
MEDDDSGGAGTSANRDADLRRLGAFFVNIHDGIGYRFAELVFPR